MKTRFQVLILVCFVLCVLPTKSRAQNKEIPITTSSKEAMDYFLQGRDHLDDYEDTIAARLFEYALQKDSNFALAYVFRSLAGTGLPDRMSNLEEATSRINNVSEGEKNLILFIQAAYIGNSKKQKECLDLLLRDYPSDKRVQFEAGNYYYNSRDYKNALLHYTLATELDSRYAMAYNMVGYSQSKLANYSEAANAFEKYIELTPQRPGGYDSYAELLLTRGYYDKSIAMYNKALELNPHFSYSLIGLGNNYVFTGDYNKARKYYQEYYDNAPTPGERYAALNLEAVSYIHEGKIEKALSVYHQYCDLAKKENDAYHEVIGLANQGFVYDELGNPQEGMKHFDSAIELLWKSDMNEVTRENLMFLSDLWHLYALGATGEFLKAAADEKVCLENVEKRSDPNDKLIFNTICGYLDFKKGEIDHAMKHFSQADMENPITLYYYALCHQHKGESHKANRLFEKISTSNVNSLSLALVRNKAFNREMSNLSYTK